MAERKLQYKIMADISAAEKSFNRLEKNLAKTGRSIESAGKAMLKLTAPLVAVGTMAFKAATDYDDAMDKIARGTGATGKTLEGLGRSFESVLKNVPSTMGDVSTAIADLNTRTGLTGSQLEAMATASLDASRMLGDNLGSVISSTTQAMNNWGIAGTNGVAFMDKLFTASQATGIKISDLAQEITTSGSTFRAMGLDMDTTISMLASFEREGVNSEAVMAAMKKGLVTLAKAGNTDLPGALQMAISSIKNAGSASEAATVAAKIFGAKAGPELAAAIREGRFELGSMNETLGKSQGAIEKASKSTESFDEKLGKLKNQTELALKPLGDKLINIANDILPKVSAAVSNFSLNVSDSTVKTGLLATALGGIVYFAGSAIVNIVKLTSALGGLILKGAALAATPWGAAILGIGGAIGTGLTFGYNLGKYFDKGTYTPYQPGSQKAKDDAQYANLINGVGKSGVTSKTSVLGTIQDVIAKNKTTTGSKIPSANLNALLGKTGGGKASGSRSSSSGSGTSVLDVQLQSITDKMKYLGSTGEAYLPTLDKMLAHTKPWSEEWKKVKDVQLQVYNNLSDVSQKQLETVQRTAEFKKQSEDSYYNNLDKKNQYGMLGNEEYLSLLQERLDNLEAAGEKFSDTWWNTFGQIDSKKSENATNLLDSLNKQYESGTLAAGNYRSAIEQIMQQYANSPTILKACQDALNNLNTTMNTLPSVASQVTDSWNNARQAIATIPQQSGEAFKSMITGSKSASEAMLDLLQNIGATVAEAIFMKTVFGGWGGTSTFGTSGLLGMLGIKFHSGGIVGEGGTPTLISPSVFSGAPRMHSGGIAGLRADEVPAILQKGETVISRNGTSNGNSTVGNTIYNITIQANDAKSFNDMLTRSKGTLEGLISNGIQRGGSLARAVKGASA